MHTPLKALLCLAVPSILATPGSHAEELFDFNVDGDAAVWLAASIDGLTESTALGGSESVMTCADVTGGSPYLRYNTAGTNSAYWLTPDGGTWETVRIRMRLLDGNPGDAGTAPLDWPGTTTAVRFSLNENKTNPLVFDANDAGWTITSESDGWVLLTQDISSLEANTVIKMRIDPLATGNAAHNFEIDSITLTTAGGDDPGTDPVSTGPNVIYILVDDMGYSDIGCFGGEIETPNIDSLANEGLSFRHFYNCAKCETTRTALMSGLYHGRGSNAAGGATLGEALKSVGYRTYAVGKWHLGTGSLIPVQQGFDNFYGFYGGYSDYFPAGIGTSTIKRDAAESNNFVSAYAESNFSVTSGNVSNQTTFPADYYITDGFGDNAVAFIQDAVTNHPDQPFFMYLAFNAPHTPLQAPTGLIAKYRNTYTDGWDKLRQEKWQRQMELGVVDSGWQLPHLRDDIPQWDDLSPEEQDAEDHRRAVFAAMVDSVDQNVGKVLAQLQLSGIADNTLVIFSSDNGAQAFDNTSDRSSSPSDEDSRWSQGPAWAAYSNAPFRYYKQSQQQGGICTPLIARWPETIAAGTMTDQPGHVVDIMATLVDLAGVDYDSLTKNDGDPVPAMDGASLRPIFEGETRPAPDFWGFEYGNSEFAVIQGDWKLASFSSSPWRLFNLKEDRTETRNLRWEYPEKVAELAALYDEWATDTYGSANRTFAGRDTRTGMSQELRYSKVLAGGLFSKPGIDITLSNIGAGTAAAMDDHWEYYVTNTSASGVAGSSDSVTFANKRFFGDGSLIAQVDSMTDMTSAGRAGLMIRDSLDADSAFFMIGLTSTGSLAQVVRSAAGEEVTETFPASQLSTPVFIRISRVGNQFTPSVSSDGSSWTELSPVVVPLAIDALGGLAASSGDTGTRATVIFREWETNDIAAYPSRARRIDGLAEYLAYALGAGPDTSALPALPQMQMAVAGDTVYPVLSFNRRLGIASSKFVIRALGDDMSRWENDSAAWTTVQATANADGVSESVRMRRLAGVAADPAAFYSLEVMD
ncbi:MAG: arylsulfatase [Verrucomicrobiota bacterium JB025]|nr:arylsulfatase [Verrucomicrobiota bacterium JB025]